MKSSEETPKAVLIAVDSGKFDIRESLDELELLVMTLDIDPVERLIQRRDSPDLSWYFGRGKVEQLSRMVKALRIDYVVADDELSPVQMKNLESAVKAHVFDRTQVILEIFARHATTGEGKIQVELAKLQYELPRMIGLGGQLSRLGGGIGTRGPGEQILQRRRSIVKKRISQLKEKLEDIRKRRIVQRKRRKKKEVSRVSIVGYTNSGKSSLLNALLRSEAAKVEDKPFATLQPITRRVKLSNGEVVLFSDTVGFIRKLPHNIIAAFRATLEEIEESDLLIHVVDISDPYFKVKIKESLEVLNEIDAADIPRILLFNKIDLVSKRRIEMVMEEFPSALFSSVKRMIGIQEVLERVEDELSNFEEEIRLRVSTEEIGEIYSYFDKVILKGQKFHDGIFEVTLRGRREIIEEVVGRVKGEVLQ